MKSVFLPLLLLFSSSGWTQDSIFHLRDYKYRTPGFRALEANLNFSSSMSSSKSDGNLMSSGQIAVAPASVQYFREVSTDRKHHVSGLSLSQRIYKMKYNAPSFDRRIKEFHSGAEWLSSTRFYNDRSMFMELGGKVSVDYSGFAGSDSVYFRSQTFESGAGLILGFGLGRIERVSDAQVAIYIIEDLERNGLLASAADAAQVNQLAGLVTDLNNRRIFDSRKRRAYELVRIDSFLRASGLVTTTDIRHFSIVNDNWSMGFNPYRLSGYQFYFRLLPWLEHAREKSTGINLLHRTYINITPAIGFSRHIPASMKWQHGYGTELYMSRSTRFDMKFRHAVGLSEWNARIFYNAGYFPHNRTMLNADFSLAAITLDYDSDAAARSIRSAVNIYGSVFLGYRTRLTGKALFYADHGKLISASDEIRSGSKGFLFSTGLVHAFF